MKSLIKRIFMCALVATTLVGCSSSTSESKVVEATPTPSATPITETVELTIDNWQDYFEVKEMVIPSYGAFDEVNRMQNYIVLALKNGLSFTGFAEISVEYAFDNKLVEFTNVDFENMKIDYDELSIESLSDNSIKERYEENKTQTSTCTLMDVELIANGVADEPSKYLSTFGLKIWDVYVNCETNSVELVPILDTFTITRIKGTIEIVKEN